jgi:hypothetical protein
MDGTSRNFVSKVPLKLKATFHIEKLQQGRQAEESPRRQPRRREKMRNELFDDNEIGAKFHA